MPTRGDSFEFDHTISHGDVDFIGELKVPALLGLLEQSAIEASSRLGFHTNWYSKQGGYWIVRRTRLERHAALGGHDRVRVRTWVDDFRRARSIRRYELRRVGETAPAITASTDWVFCDATSGRPRRVPPEMEKAFSGAAGSLPPRPRAAAVALPDAASAQTLVRRVRASHLDHIVHVNNGVWAGFLEDGAEALLAHHGWSVPEMLSRGGAFRLKRLDLEYLTEGLPGDTLTVYSAFAGEPPPDSDPGGHAPPLSAAETEASLLPQSLGSAGEEATTRAPLPRNEGASFDLRQSVEKSGAATAIRSSSYWQWLRCADVLGHPPAR